ncbi:MAG TPA: rhomboid family intramembrane serine protease [Phaeodactylibacter sp.]|nr:rhomboid family intramembrane serine protease [Phaeodactylibacter sp.]
MSRITEVTKILLIINVIVYFASSAILGSNINAANFLAFHMPGTGFQPFQLVSHMFMHGNTSHLFFNMFGLYMFGPPLEMAWGPKRFLFYYFFAGFGALITHILLSLFMGSVPAPVVGASGALFGLLAGFGYLYPNQRILLLIPPIPMKAKYFVLIYAGIELFLGFGNMLSGIAHFAHVGGAFFGFLLMLYWEKFGSRF